MPKYAAGLLSGALPLRPPSCGNASTQTFAEEIMTSTGPFPRALSEQEREIAKWMIEHAPGENQKYADDLVRATVTGACGCGCPSVNFAIDGEEPPEDAGMHVFGDYFYGNEDSVCGAMVFDRGGQLAGIEFYPLAVDQVPPQIPEPSSLRPAKWNQ